MAPCLKERQWISVPRGLTPLVSKQKTRVRHQLKKQTLDLCFCPARSATEILSLGSVN
jgi:hypothetical protein